MPKKQPKEKKPTLIDKDVSNKEKRPTLLGAAAAEGGKPKARMVSPRKPRKKSPQKPTAENKPVSSISKKKPSRVLKVVFVCTGNTCRSAMAKYIFEDYLKNIGSADYFSVDSAGLSAMRGKDMSEQAKEALAEMGISGFHHSACPFYPNIISDSDLIVCMTFEHKSAIGKNLPNVVTVSELTGGGEVTDPWGGTVDDYRQTAAYLKYACYDVYNRALAAVKD